MKVLLGILATGAIGGILLGIYFKFFTPDDFSIWNHDWFGKNLEKDQDYLNK